jgi:phosphotransferase system HPr-like phosphotransfer protein
MAKRRPTQAEYAQRIDEVYGLLLSRVSYATICRHASQKWQVTPRQTDRYIGAARGRIMELLESDQREQLAKALGAYETIFAKQMAAADLRGARATMKDIVDLLGLAAPQRSKLEFSIEDLDREIARLEAQVAREQGPA